MRYLLSRRTRFDVLITGTKAEFVKRANSHGIEMRNGEVRIMN